MKKVIQFLKPDNPIEEGGISALPAELKKEPEQNCPNCHKDIPVKRLFENYMVCSCGYHFRMRARDRINMLADEGSFNELFSGITGSDPLSFPGYEEKIEKSKRASGEEESVITGEMKIGGEEVLVFVMEPLFMMGSLGSAAGEKITSLFEYAIEKKRSVIGFTASGGARMQEGLLSLMQMAKVSAAVRRFSDEGLLYISVLTDPTTGGVTASFASQGDIILSEPGATFGFAGKRVIEKAAKETLPEGFQTAEFVLEHGFIDEIVSRSEQKRLLPVLIKMHKREGKEK